MYTSTEYKSSLNIFKKSLDIRRVFLYIHYIFHTLICEAVMEIIFTPTSKRPHLVSWIVPKIYGRYYLSYGQSTFRRIHINSMTEGLNILCEDVLGSSVLLYIYIYI